jgi:hypothetical protein
VQTTAQRLFSVKPVAGIVEPGGQALVTIKLKQSQVESATISDNGSNF